MNRKVKLTVTSPVKIEGNWFDMEPPHRLENRIDTIKDCFKELTGKECEVKVEVKDVQIILTKVHSKAHKKSILSLVEIDTQPFNNIEEAQDFMRWQYCAFSTQVTPICKECKDNYALITYKENDWKFRIDWQIEEIVVWQSSGEKEELR